VVGVDLTAISPGQPRAKFLSYLVQGANAIQGVPPQAFLDANESLRRGLCAAYFLSDTRRKLDVAAFLIETVPMLLRRLHRTVQHQRVEYTGQIRGRVDWQATYKARYRDDYNPILYVCRQPQRRDDTPENQLLKYMLLAIERLVSDVPEALRCAECWSPETAGEKAWLEARVKTLEHRLRASLAHIRLREVEPPPAITPRHLLRARTSKTELYGQVALLYDQYKEVVLRYRWERVQPIFRRTLLLPAPETPQGDLFLRLTAVGLLSANGGGS
jgi:hypothetical protein